jgi:hypothetical protein
METLGIEPRTYGLKMGWGRSAVTVWADLAHVRPPSGRPSLHRMLHSGLHSTRRRRDRAPGWWTFRRIRFVTNRVTIAMSARRTSYRQPATSCVR